MTSQSETPNLSTSHREATAAKLRSARACAAKLAMNTLQDEEEDIKVRLLAATVLNGIDTEVLTAVAVQYKGFAP